MGFLVTTPFGARRDGFGSAFIGAGVMLCGTQNGTSSAHCGSRSLYFLMRRVSFVDFGNRLRQERKRLGLSQTELGAIGSVSKASQLNYESGTRNPDSAYLMAVAAAGVDIGFLLTGARTAPATLTPEEQALLDNYKHADEQGRDAARRVLSSLAKQRKAA